MRPFKKYVPRFGSQPDSSQSNESRPDPPAARRAGASCLSSRKKRGSQRHVTRPLSILRVRLAKFTDRDTREDETPVEVTQKPPVAGTSGSGEPGGETQNPNTDSVPADQSIFFFSQGSSVNIKDEKERTKLMVLRTISRMLEENALIRQRLVLLTKSN